ncbi:MAG: alpha-D-ribose 1-methylphosphonate 5-triphosphate diphosphatase [Pseudomonadota bacterium]
MDNKIVIYGGTSLVRDDEDSLGWSQADIAVTGSRLGKMNTMTGAAIRGANAAFNADGLLVLPGIVDLHGDAFERQIQPRPGTAFSHDIAMADTDRQLICNGITTACHGLTYSWEGGLRGRDAALALIDQLALQRDTFQADHLLHLRFENHHLDGLQDALDWISQGKVDFFAFNEHMPSIAGKSALPEKLAVYAERARCSVPDFLQRLHAAQSRASEVAAAINTLAAACRLHDIPMASHDDETCLDRERYHGLGVTISEFPKTREALCTAVALGNRVVMGAPNVLLGGSHCGGLAAAEAVRDGMCDILSSDYYYPSMLHAAFKLANNKVCSLPKAWSLISENPAIALGLDDRGRIKEGCRADLLLVDASVPGTARLIATIAGGKLVYCTEPERMLALPALSLAA